MRRAAGWAKAGLQSVTTSSVSHAAKTSVVCRVFHWGERGGSEAHLPGADDDGVLPVGEGGTVHVGVQLVAPPATSTEAIVSRSSVHGGWQQGVMVLSVLWGMHAA